MKNRKLNQLLVAGMISAAMMASGISVQAADFSDDTSTVEEQICHIGETFNAFQVGNSKP